MPGLNELSPVQRFLMVRIVPWFIVLMGGLCMYLGFMTVYKARQSTDWPSVPGNVVESGIRTEHSSSSSGSSGSSTTYHANVVYEYRVDGEKLTGKRVSFGEYGREIPDHAQAIADRYPVGKEVPVYHDPESPDDAVLEPGAHGVPWLFIVLGIPILLFGFGMVYFLPGKAAKRQ